MQSNFKPHLESFKIRWIINYKNHVKKKMFINAFKYKCKNFMNENLY